MSDRAPRRLLFALAASALVHTAVMQAVEGAAARRAQRVAPAQLTVTLPPPRAELSQQVAAQPPAELPIRTYTRQSASNEIAQEPRQRPATPEPALLPMPMPAHSSHAALTTHGEAVMTQVSDPTYYGARSLDVYPRALGALDLGALAASGKVRATVYIDESGIVNDVRAIQAANLDAEQAARDLLMRARFSPAYKDGRVVKAQVVVSLE